MMMTGKRVAVDNEIMSTTSPFNQSLDSGLAQERKRAYKEKD